MKWFGERADLVIVMFDAHKLDISDELKRVMELFIPHIDKIRIVLNKADSISTQQLMRVYGALMWSLGKVLNTPEVCRVYMVRTANVILFSRFFRTFILHFVM